MRPAILLTTLLLCAGAQSASAQSSHPSAALPADGVVLRAQNELAKARRSGQGSGLKSRVGRMFTGAVMGGWLGYFASHVAVSDWQSGSSGMGVERGTWAAAGVALGVVAGRLTSGSGGNTDPLRPTLASSRKRIEREEIAASGAVDAYELVRSLRKEWLIPRGVNSFRESARGSAGFGQPTVVVPGADHILVYLDNARLGGTQNLSDVSLQTLDRVEFIPGAEATMRWGTGHAHGVILLTTMSGEHR
jgi:hypothetical protein